MPQEEAGGLLDGKHGMFTRSVGAPIGRQVSKETLTALHVKPPGGAHDDFSFRG